MLWGMMKRGGGGGGRMGLGLLLLMFLFVRPAWGGFVVEQNALTVTSPDKLKGTYESAIGNFGVPQYGGTLSGTLKYPPVNRNACDKFSTPTFHAEPGARPFFALVDRGSTRSPPTPRRPNFA